MKKLQEAERKTTAIQKARTPDEVAAVRKKLTGTESKSIAEILVTQMAGLQRWGSERTDEEKGDAAVDLLGAFGATNTIEAFLSVQMVAVHEAATVFLQRATLAGQTLEGSDANVLRAVRLMRLFKEQVELRAKLNGKTSEQRVTVEHVHVHQGGQAIVGTVSAAKAGQGEGEI